MFLSVELASCGAQTVLDQKTAAASGSRLEELRKTYPNAGRPWSAEDDATLKELFLNALTEHEMSARFGRKPTAIHARLIVKGLIEDDIGLKEREAARKSTRKKKKE